MTDPLLEEAKRLSARNSKFSEILDDLTRAKRLLAELVERLERAERAVTALKPFYRETRRDVEGLTRKMPPDIQAEYLVRFKDAEEALAAHNPDSGEAS